MNKRIPNPLPIPPAASMRKATDERYSADPTRKVRGGMARLTTNRAMLRQSNRVLTT